MDEIKSKHVSESETEQVRVVFNSHLNPQGRLFGGILVSWIDVVAGIVAQRHCNRYVTTAQIDKLDFKSPVYAGSTVILYGRITCVGNTSMEVRVDAFVEDISGKRELVNTAYLVLVALDKNGKPTAVPKLICDTDEEKAEEQAGLKRRLLRKKRRAEEF